MTCSAGSRPGVALAWECCWKPTHKQAFGHPKPPHAQDGSHTQLQRIQRLLPRVVRRRRRRRRRRQLIGLLLRRRQVARTFQLPECAPPRAWRCRRRCCAQRRQRRARARRGSARRAGVACPACVGRMQARSGCCSCNDMSSQRAWASCTAGEHDSCIEACSRHKKSSKRSSQVQPTMLSEATSTHYSRMPVSSCGCCKVQPTP